MLFYWLSNLIVYMYKPNKRKRYNKIKNWIIQTFQIWKSGTFALHTHIKEFKWCNHIIRTLWLFLRFFSPNLKWRESHRLSIIRGYFGNLKKIVRTLLRVAFDLLHSHLTVRSSSHLGESFWDPLPSFFKRLRTFSLYIKHIFT